MLVLLTGTPGTGKHTVGPRLAELLDYDYLDVSKLIGKKGEEVEISAGELNALVSPFLHDNTVVVSHIAHFIKSKLKIVVVVLRCRPDVLSKRLKKRGYSPDKIYDNVMFEALDGSVLEAMEANKLVIQFDNSKHIGVVLKRISTTIESGDLNGDKSIDYSAYIAQIEKRLRSNGGAIR
jgi:adenylate kinase